MTKAKMILLSPLLKVFFRLLYHQFAWSYDLVAATVSLGMWRDWVLSVLPYLEGPRTLELGHGPGHLLAALQRKGVWACGLDSSPQMGRLAARRLKKLGGLGPLLVNGYAQFLPFADQSFHQVVATFPSEYILESGTVREVKRVLVPGGRLVVLPLAWITGARLSEKAAAALFKITGQAPAWDERFLDPLRQAGFNVTTGTLHLASSSLLLVHAIKKFED